MNACYLQAASDVYSPITGEVTEVNEALVDEPAKVSPTTACWRYAAGRQFMFLVPGIMHLCHS